MAAAAGNLLLDTRGLAKPNSFNGNEDAWKDWSFVFMSYTAMLDEGTHDGMVAAAGRDREIDPAGLDPDLAAKGRTLYHMLVMLVKGRAQQILRSVAAGNGFEVWRKFVRHYEPNLAARHVGTLQQLLQPTFRDGQNWADDFMKWRTEVNRYESSTGSRIGDDIKVAIVLARAPSQIRAHLQIQANTFTGDFDRLETTLDSYLTACRPWG